MEDFDALASSLAAGLGDARGCLILSRDGSVLGSSPTDAEARLTPIWVRFAALGDTERGFVQFGAESWCYVRRGLYGAFAIAGPGARPGLVLDQMDQGLLAAEQGRTRHDGFGARGGEVTHPPTMRPRTLLHPEPHNGKEPVVIDVPRTPAAAEASTDLPPLPDRDLGFGPLPRVFEAGAAGTREVPAGEVPAQAEPAHAEPESTPAPQPDLDLADPRPQEGPPAYGSDLDQADPSPPDEPSPDEPAAPEPSAWDESPEPWEPDSDEDDDVDRFSLAREFGQLLQRGEGPADG